MPNTLKAAWLGQSGTLFSLSLESDIKRPDYMRLQAQTMVYPTKPSPEHPLRHVTLLTYLSMADLELLHATIGEQLMKHAASALNQLDHVNGEPQ